MATRPQRMPRIRKGARMQVTRKRYSMMAAAAAGVLVLVGCGGENGTADDPTEISEAATAVDVGIGEITPRDMDHIAVMIQAGPTYSDSAAKAAGAEAAGEDLGVDVEIYWSDLDPTTELSNYNTIVQDGGYGGLGIQSVSPQMCKTIADTVMDAQMLVAGLGGPLCSDGTDSGEALVAPGTVAFVEQNNLIEGAKIMFESAAEQLEGPQKVVLAFGNQGHTTVTAHEVAWEEFAADHPDWEVVGTLYTDWTTPGAYAETQNVLQANPDATVVFSTFIDITAGVAKAVADQGLGDQISVYETSGGTELSVDLLKSGELDGSVPGLSFDVGYATVEALVAAGKGELESGLVRLPEFDEIGLITPETVDSFTP
ncbi:sugar ABC transporter substrate-binding protein [Leucobacter weissii]|uniref:Sugar ABC transporter substrate-binding protein n=1 Tax=Leucobacter weissii TaxID=1983706 RepID=A0A939MJK4_9MICO|nr:sugar ABC transporter substrate-binding protein [Leucobacter weissii]MBO1901430.1 sugar ABC transporter substrate-binding protein [Leucobacter weissii]